MEEANQPAGFKTNSIYVIAKGLGAVVQKYRDAGEKEMQSLYQDFQQLEKILTNHGFIGYPALPIACLPSIKKTTSLN